MQSKEILAVPQSAEWAVINPSQQNKSRGEGDFTSVEPSRVLFGKRVSGLHYKLNTEHGTTWSFDKNDFKTTDNRSFGFMVELPARNDQEQPRYIVVKPTNFIELAGTYNAHWHTIVQRRVDEEAERRRLREIREANEQRRSAIYAERRSAKRVEVERLEESVKQSISVLLGAKAEQRAYIDTDINATWTAPDTPEEELNLSVSGTVRIDIKDFLRLIEKVGN